MAHASAGSIAKTYRRIRSEADWSRPERAAGARTCCARRAPAWFRSGQQFRSMVSSRHAYQQDWHWLNEAEA
eukprot:5110100-Pleurochrysis_carterae.AAC.1